MVIVRNAGQWKPNVVQKYAGLSIIILVTLACIVVFLYDEFSGTAPDNVVQNLLTFITGIGASIVGVHIGETAGATAARNADAAHVRRTDLVPPHVPRAPLPSTAPATPPTATQPQQSPDVPTPPEQTATP